jgi:hypothetical protein
VRYRLAAGDRALRSFSNREAETHFRSALRILERAPHSHDHDEWELRALEGLRIVLTAVKGQGFEELAALLNRAAELCRRLGRDAQLCGMLRANAGHHFFLADMRKATALALEAVAIAASANDRAQLAFSQVSLGAAYFWVGPAYRKPRGVGASTKLQFRTIRRAGAS